MKKRAISVDQKQIKQNEIINAALKLLKEGQFPLPSVSEIADEAGVAKGTVYLYFKSKEEIYLSVMSEHFQQAVKDLMDRFHADKSCSQTIAKFFLELAAEKPKIMYLAHITPLVLESNVSDDFIVGFKKGLLQMTLQLAEIIQSKYGIPKSKAKEKFLLSYNIFIGMHQHSVPPHHVQMLLEKNNLLDLKYNFSKRLNQIFESLWRE